MKKRLLSLSLAICLMLTMLPTTATAATNQSEIVKNAITYYISKYNSSFGSSYNGKAWGCCAFCNYVWKGVFGKDFYANKHTTVNSSSATSNIYGFLSNNHAKTGDVLWCHTDSNSITHYMIILAYDSKGVWLSDGKGTGVLWHNNEKISYDDVNYKKYFGGNCKLRLYKVNDALWNSVSKNYANLPAPASPNIGGSSQNTTKLTVSSTISGKWSVTIPANYKLVCYDSADATRSSTYYIAAKTESYKLTCTQKATLSNGKTRYFFVSGDNKNLWFDYTSGMSVVPGTSTDVKSYTVTFDANEGSVGQRTKMVVAGNAIGSMPIPVRAGYIFLGWCTAKEGSGLVVNEYNFTVNQNQTLYALWKMEQTPAYAVTFNPNGGSVSQSSKSVTSGQKYGTLPTPSRNGYTFDGWFTSANGGTQITAATTVNLTGNQTLFAHWSEDKQTYTLYFDPDGGSVDITSKKVTYGEYYGELPTPYREGYKFEGWYSGRNGTGSPRWPVIYVTTKSDETVYAHWSLIDTRIRVHFDTNGGPDHSYLNYYESNDTYGNLPSTEWAGYIFEGWYTKPTGGTKIYSTTKLIQDSEHTLYAHWTEEETPPEPSTLTISGLRVTVSNRKIQASASVTSNYDLMDFSYGDGANSGGAGFVGKNRKTFEYTYEMDYRNRAYVEGGIYTFQLTCTDMSGKSVTATYDYYLPGPNEPQYFSCNVRIFCVNGKTVNLYNNPGDSSRVDYFSLGQSVGSTFGVYMPDGTTWYRVSVTSKGNVITVWLKYESDKMTVRNLG